MLRLKTRYYRWFPPEKHSGFVEKIESIEFASTALLLVDVYLPDRIAPDVAEEKQNAKLSVKDYALWRRTIVEGVIPSAEAARAANMPVVYVCNMNVDIALGRSAFARKIQESLGFDVEHAFKGFVVKGEKNSETESASLTFLAGAAPQKGDYFIGKTVYSGFFNTPLDSLLRNLGIKTLICAGFRLDVCLLGTILDALYRNYCPILLRDATLASELPDEIDVVAFTERMCLHFDTFIGSSTSSKDFIAACKKYMNEKGCGV